MTNTRRTALVTGANRGIGLAACELLGEAGYRVAMGSRDAERGAAAATALAARGLAVECLPLDVTRADSVAQAVSWFEDLEVGLDVLVNNAGIALDGFDGDVVRDTMAVNVHGVMRLTDALVDMLPARATVVMVSSGVGELASLSPACRARFDAPLPDRQALAATLEEFEQAVRDGTHTSKGWPSSAYQVSKAALNAYTRLLAAEHPTMRINAMCPGWVRTDMGGAQAERTPREGAEGIMQVIALGADGPTGSFFRDGEPIPW